LPRGAPAGGPEPPGETQPAMAEGRVWGTGPPLSVSFEALPRQRRRSASWRAPAAERLDLPRAGEAAGLYQWTPRIRCASATCSVDACSSGSFLPLAAALSGKTL